MGGLLKSGGARAICGAEDHCREPSAAAQPAATGQPERMLPFQGASGVGVAATETHSHTRGDLACLWASRV